MKSGMNFKTSALAHLMLIFHVLFSSAIANDQTVVGDIGQLKVMPHPRSVDIAALRKKAEMETNIFGELKRRTRIWSIEGLPSESSLEPNFLPAGNEKHTEMQAIQQLAFGEENKVLPAALDWLATNDNLALADAKRRLNNLARWDPHGVTGFLSHDQVGLSIAWTLALAYDWLYPELNDVERNRIVSAIASRLNDILGKGPFGLDDGHRIDSFPYDSHGAVALARVSVICTVMAGTDSLFDRCFRNILPRYLSRPVPWGVGDGGYANGTGYAQWDVSYTQIIVWSLLKKSLKVDLTKIPWAQGYGRYIAYFLPPGTPAGLFGDGAEQNWRYVWATQAKAFAGFVPSPLADWYARQQFGEDASQLALLLAPPRDWEKVPGQIPPGVANAVHIPSIGWVAMHSNLADRGRNSVYFKSSPYGSFNHSHADQNSFVINSKGLSLAIDSGYYDYYNSPHWKDWYKQTRAHNAITFDGGQGQLFDTMAAKGSITKFQHGKDVDVVTGDATIAYGGGLTRAVRTLVYLRPNTLLVYDSLASVKPRTWEWNIHALNKMDTDGSRRFEIIKEGIRLCGRVLDGPELVFAQTDRFSVDPQGNYPKQWHGTFSTTEKRSNLNMLTMLTVGCGPVNVEVTGSGANLRVTIDGYNLTYSGEGQVEIK